MRHVAVVIPTTAAAVHLSLPLTHTLCDMIDALSLGGTAARYLCSISSFPLLSPCFPVPIPWTFETLE